MYNSLNFYNHFGNGDIFESREFVRKLKEMIPHNEKDSLYFMGKSPKLIRDLKNIYGMNTHMPEWCDPRRMYIVREGNLYINTWIGRDGQYVKGGYACTVEELYRMYNEILERLGHPEKLPGSPLDYLTTIDYTMYNTKRVDYMLEVMKSSNYRYCFISNGNVSSNQAVNFDFTPVIRRLAREWPDILFFVTQPIDPALTTTGNIIDANDWADMDGGTNLPELSYLSTKCDLIIGRNSGPQVFTWTKENCERDILNITFSKHVDCAHFVRLSPTKMKRFWSNDTETDKVFDSINKVIAEDFYT